MINSREYWNERFATGKWDQHDGRQQSIFFSFIAQSAFPSWLTKELSENEWGFLDYGCANGSGTAYLAKQFPTCHVTGVDFSAEAVRLAQEAYPHCSYIVGDMAKEIIQSDVLFSSNTLEHFQNPMPVLRSLIKNSQKHTILLLPFEDDSDIPEHFVRFSADMFPHTIESHDLSAFRFIDCRKYQPTFWAGKQLLLVYTNKAYREDSLYSLGQVYHDTLAPVWNDNERLQAEVHAAQAEKQTLQEGVQAAQAELRQLQEAVNAQQAKNRRLREHAHAALSGNRRLREREQAAQAEKERLRKHAQAALRQLQEREQAAQAEKERLHGQLEQLEDRLSRQCQLQINQQHLLAQQVGEALHAGHLLETIRSYKLAHLLSRTRNQFFKGSGGEKRAFVQWMLGHSSRNFVDTNHRYNPLFRVNPKFCVNSKIG